MQFRCVQQQFRVDMVRRVHRPGRVPHGRNWGTAMGAEVHIVSIKNRKLPNLSGVTTAKFMTKTTMQRKLSPRAEYLQQEHQRVKESASLLERYKALKDLTVEIAYFDEEGLIRRGEMKYTVNLAHAKSLFRFSCPNNECVGGDFDLSTELANAIAGGHEDVSGELVCQGWRSKTTIGNLSCHNIMRYKLSIGY
jgi:hypothetical protein